MAITATITVAASLITFGAASPAGAAIGAARVVHIVRKWAPDIVRGINAFKLKGLTKVADKVPDFKWSRDEMTRIRNLRNNNGRPNGSTNWGSPLSARDQQVLQDGPSLRGVDLGAKLRRCEQLTPEEQKHIDDLNTAPANLPAHEGPALRHKDLSPERLAEFEPGSTYIEQAEKYDGDRNKQKRGKKK